MKICHKKASRSIPLLHIFRNRMMSFSYLTENMLKVLSNSENIRANLKLSYVSFFQIQLLPIVKTFLQKIITADFIQVLTKYIDFRNRFPISVLSNQTCIALHAKRWILEISQFPHRVVNPVSSIYVAIPNIALANRFQCNIEIFLPPKAHLKSKVRPRFPRKRTCIASGIYC